MEGERARLPGAGRPAAADGAAPPARPAALTTWRAQPWLHDAVEVRDSLIEGRGLFAVTDLPAGTVLVRLGGRLVDTTELTRLIAAADADPASPYVDTVTVGDDRHLVLPPGTPAHFGNHSCDPSLWLLDSVTLATRHDIAAGEELTVDYATHTGVGTWTMDCSCGAPQCRGRVTGDDWRRPDLQQRYAGHWTPALAARIATASGPPP